MFLWCENSNSFFFLMNFQIFLNNDSINILCFYNRNWNHVVVVLVLHLDQLDLVYMDLCMVDPDCWIVVHNLLMLQIMQILLWKSGERKNVHKLNAVIQTGCSMKYYGLYTESLYLYSRYKTLFWFTLTRNKLAIVSQRSKNLLWMAYTSAKGFL